MGKPLPSIEEIQKRMMDHVGIVRTGEGLTKQLQWLESFTGEHAWGGNLDLMDKDELTRYFMVMTASLVTKAALHRTESRGGHYRMDFPCEDDHNWRRKRLIQNRKAKEGIAYEQDQITAAT